MRCLLAAALALILGTAAAAATAQTVSLGGSLGGNALLIIDGKPRNVAVGSTVGGVRLVSVTGGDAVVEVAGKKVTLQLGGAQVNLGGKPSEGTGRRIELSADSGGHFFTAGTINGKTVRFVVDTGATSVSMGQPDAERIGLDYKNGQKLIMRTANGDVPAYRVTLASIRVGDVQVYDIEGTVLLTPLPYVLLGNSYLSHFQMRRDNDHMTLEKRF